MASKRFCMIFCFLLSTMEAHWVVAEAAKRSSYAGLV